jgi:hypothetical protein
MRGRTLIVAVLAAVAASSLTATAGPRPAGKVDFNFQVRPLLADRCFACHGPDEKKRKAKLRLDTPEGAARVLGPGRPQKSELYRRITAADDEERMPPRHSNRSLSAEEIDVLRRWIAEGAAFKPHWSFLPLPARVPVPDVSEPRWPSRPLDHFILARLDREGLRPSPPAPREDWIRRVSFDLTGLPPTPGEVDAFLADASPDAFGRVADRLLASPHFGERMAQEWLDVARYADSFGYQADGDTNVWPWRDWVIRAFNRNLPYDQFLTWQIAGDLLPGATREQRLATAFCRLHRMTNEGGSIPEEWRIEYVSDRVHTLATAVLGLTMECCRCHDHKYDPLTMRDYYSLGAFFNSIDEWGTYDSAPFRPTPTVLLPTPEQERSLAELAGEVRRREARLREVVRARESAFRSWLGKGHVKADIPGLVGHFPLDGVGPGGRLDNLADRARPGSTSPANTLVPGVTGKALRFTGDDAANFPNTPVALDRAHPFTAAFWLRLPEVMKEGIVFHREAGTDTGFHGIELSFDQGRLSFDLVRFWPGNAAAVRTRDVLPPGRWVHVAASHDGSGRAKGLHLYLDGRPAEVEVVRDCLSKNIEVGGGLSFGERFRSTGLKGGLLDEVRIYSRALTAVEVAQVHDDHSLRDALAARDEVALREYYFAAVDAVAAKAREELRQARERLFATQTGVFEVMAMEAMARPRPAFVLARGAYDAPKDRPVSRNTPAALPGFPTGTPHDRLGLARWLTRPDHPLTARVAVNRFWQTFFGRGIVATADNFGSQGTLPTHPELLDRLARDFVDSGWDVKRLCRTIVLSSTYRQRSAAAPELRERDPDNLLWARGPARRLPAETLRDAAIAAGGLLVRRVGGPPARPYQPPGLWHEQNGFLPEYVPDKGEGLYRRSLYTFWRRTSPPPNMTIFDAPSREVCTARRSTTSTPLQPLVLLNDPQFVEAARAIGERLLREAGPAPAERLTLAFRLAATRRPTERELRLLVELYESQRAAFGTDPAAAARYLQVGDREAAAGLDPAELAAAAVVANAILNLDAAVMKR